MQSFPYQNVLVLGLARTGLAAVHTLNHYGLKPLGWDDNAASCEQAAAVSDITITPPDEIDWAQLDALVVSPGVPYKYPKPHPVIAQARAKNIPILGDIDLFMNLIPHNPVIGITGTNGKSTTTALVHHLLTSSGKTAHIGGNIGTAALDLLPNIKAGDPIVLELSSYQLDLYNARSFDITACLNITPDHIDRHGSFDSYVAAKAKIFNDSDQKQTAFISIDDPELKVLSDANPKISRISKTDATASLSFADDILKDGDIQLDLSQNTQLLGTHNWQNITFAYAITKTLGLTTDQFIKGLKTFTGLEHRLESVTSFKNMHFVNDSKATNAEAASNALACFDHIHWIVGGMRKKEGLKNLYPFLPHVAHAYVIGAQPESTAQELEGKVPYTIAGTVDIAVEKAMQNCLKNELSCPIVLSPACASFDQFASFEHRGHHFKTVVMQAIKATKGTVTQ